VKKFLKWMGLVVGGLAVVVLLLLAGVYFASSRELAREYDAADAAVLPIPTDATEIAEGHRIAQLGGCLHCHGDTMKGALVDDIPHLVRLVAPNISTLLPKYSDAQLATVLRKGVKPDGRSVLFMPSEMFRHLSDRDLGRLIAYLRTVPVTIEGETEKTEVRIVGRVLVAKGDFKPAAAAIPLLPAAVKDADDAIGRGRYLAMNFCSECHGQSLEGFAPIHAPPLEVVKGYSLEQFTRLMKEGMPVGDRELKLMGPTSRARFASFTPNEIAAVHTFLSTL
jgi:mono/diheme cytochrome c family protein